jgi:tetratricopeptide (TPR) repeat protein
MATNKNLSCRRGLLFALVVAALGTAGCGPPGPRALLEGKRLLEQGESAAAIDKLTQAAELMDTNAQAWNYLGLAYHLAGQQDAAAGAYQKALRFDHDLVAAHFNLGCLYLEEGQPDKLEAARNELTAFTLHQGNSPAGWVKLGTVQVRLRDAASAEKSFEQALQLGSNNPEALNGLGLAELQFNRRREAVACFNNALAQQPNYGPALLNLAVLSQGNWNEWPLALQRYRQYLALTPHPANWDAVNAAAHQLEQELNAAARSTADLSAAPPRSTPNNPTRPPVVANEARPEVAADSANNPDTGSDTGPATRPEVVQLPRETAAQPVASGGQVSRVPATSPGSSTDTDTVIVSPPVEDVAPGEAPKQGFFQRINPFHREPLPVSSPTPLPEESPSGIAPASPSAPVPHVARYNYVSPGRPAEGNRAQAERFFAQAAEAQHERRLQDAVALYRAATQADPSFFEAQSNLGLAAFDLGDMTQALLAYEIALAIRPDSFNARFNFALALIKANYIIDAAQELERLLATARDEPAEHLAMVHLTLANLYAEQFHRPASARPHYQKVLALDPENSQATVIRYWLRDHP